MKHVVLFMVLGTSIAFAQQDPQFTQFHRNRMLFNPAFAGMTGSVCLGTHYRTQWMGFPGAPKTSSFWFNKYVPEWDGGLALQCSHDVLGFEKNNRVQVMLSKHRTIGMGRLSFGGGLNLQQKTLRGNWVAPDNTTGDQNIPAPTASDWMAGADAGIWYHSYRVYAGLSGTQLTQGDFKDGSVSYASARHYFLSAGTRFYLFSDPDLELRIHFLGKSDTRSSTADISAEVWWRSSFFAGTGWRPGDAMLFSAGARVGLLMIGYSYDVTTSALRGHSSNTHEISIKYCHPIKRTCKCRSVENPRNMWGDRVTRHVCHCKSIFSFNTDW